MEQSEVNTYLGELLKAHEVDTSAENDWFVPNNLLPAVRCFWNENGENKSGRLDVQLLIEEGVVLEECFAGIGEGKAGFLDGMENFTINSFHVLLAAFWDKNDLDQVETEQWNIGKESYTAYIGNFGMRGTDGIHPNVLEETFNVIENAIKESKINTEVSWARTFFCNIGEERIFEALLNNESWINGEKALKSIEWPKSDGYYSVRNFLVLKRNP